MKVSFGLFLFAAIAFSSISAHSLRHKHRASHKQGYLYLKLETDLMREANERESRINSMDLNDSPSFMATHDFQSSHSKRAHAKFPKQPRFKQAEDMNIQMPNDDYANPPSANSDGNKKSDFTYDQLDMEEDAELKSQLFRSTDPSLK